MVGAVRPEALAHLEPHHRHFTRLVLRHLDLILHQPLLQRAVHHGVHVGAEQALRTERTAGVCV